MSVRIPVTDQETFLGQLGVEGMCDLYVACCDSLERAPSEYDLIDIVDWGLVSIVQRCGVNLPIRDTGRFFAGIRDGYFETWAVETLAPEREVRYEAFAMKYLRKKGFDPILDS